MVAALGMLAKQGQLQWGDLGTWASSIATFLALIVAAVAIAYQRRDFKTTERQRRHAQASAISVEVAGVPRLTADGAQVWETTVHNSSAYPIFGCAVNTVIVGEPAPSKWAKLSLGTIPAGKSQPKWITYEPSTIYVEVGFTDSEGRFWVRRWTGSLIQVPLPPGAVMFGGPQAFEVAEYIDPRPKGIAKSPELTEAVEQWARTSRLLNLRQVQRHRAKGQLA